MKLETCLGFFQGRAISYSTDRKKFRIIKDLPYPAVSTLDQLILRTPGELRECKEPSHIFLSKMIEAFSQADKTKWLKASHTLLIALESLESEHLKPAIESIKQSQSLYKQTQQELSKESPYFLRDDKEFVLSAVKTSRYQLQHASERLKNDPEVVLKALEHDGRSLYYASKSLKSDIDFAKKALAIDGSSISYLSAEIKAHKELGLLAVNDLGSSLEHLSQSLQDDRDVVEAAIKNFASSIRFASSRLQKDRNLALLAVLQDGASYFFLDKTHKNDYELVKIAVESCAETYQDLPPKFQEQNEIILSALKKDGLMLEHVPGDLKTQARYILLAARQNFLALYHAPSSFCKDPELIKKIHPYMIHQLISETKAKQAFEKAGFILSNIEGLFLHDDHQIVQYATWIHTLSDESSCYKPKNPYFIYGNLNHPDPALKSLDIKASLITDSFGTLNPEGFDSNLEALKSLKLTFHDLPAEINSNTLTYLFAQSEARFSSLPLEALQQVNESIIEQTSLTWSSLKSNLLDDAYLNSLLLEPEVPKDAIPLEKAAFYMILKSLMDLDETIAPGSHLSTKEQALIAFSASCQACKGGKKEAISLTYELLAPKYRLHKSLNFSELHEEVQSSLSLLLSSPSPLLYQLTQEEQDKPLDQLSHQSIYIKNSLHKYIGLNWELDFDLQTHCLYSPLVQKTPLALCQEFYKHFTPSHLAAHIKQAFTRRLKDEDAKKARDIFNQITSFLAASYDLASCFSLDGDYSPVALTDYGAKALLTQAGYLNPA